MKKFLALFALAALISCSDDDDGITPVSQQVQNALSNKYPNATNVVWKSDSGFLVADFKDPTTDNVLYDCEAWFSPQGKWYMTETDIPYSALPDAVKAAFEASEYAEWYIDDVDKVEREATATLYIIEAEARDSDETEIDLYYTEDGTLVKSIVDGSGEGYMPIAPAGSINSYIAENYPDAIILDYDREGSFTEVDILDAGIVRELYFDAKGDWLRTTTDILPAALPQAVLEAIAASDYQLWQIDEAELVVTPREEYYTVELESGDQEVNLRITPEGEIL